MFLRAIFLIIRDSLGSNVKPMEKDYFFYYLFVLYLLILDGVPEEKVKMDYFSPICWIWTSYY